MLLLLASIVRLARLALLREDRHGRVRYMVRIRSSAGAVPVVMSYSDMYKEVASGLRKVR